MKKLFVTMGLILFVIASYAQDQPKQDQPKEDKSKKEKKEKKPLIGLGVKAGLNYANITNASAINASNKTGFMIGVFFAPPSKGIIGSKTELIFSRQGYNFKTNTKSGTVDLNYLIIPQGMSINITRFAQLQVGIQMAFLLNAKTDTSQTSGTGNPYSSMMDYYNRFDYGIGAGIDIFPIRNLVVGARYNMSFGDIYKQPTAGDPMAPPIPKIDAKNNVVQFFVGVRF